MKKIQLARQAAVFTAIAFVIGVILILTSAAIGNSMGQSAIESQGGTMDTAQYHRIIDENTANFRSVGLVISIVGGIGFLMSGNALYHELEQ